MRIFWLLMATVTSVRSKADHPVTKFSKQSVRSSVDSPSAPPPAPSQELDGEAKGETSKLQEAMPLYDQPEKLTHKQSV